MLSSIALGQTALFLDVDGTLVPIAPTPEAVYFDPELSNLLAELYEATDKALCLVSGRDHHSLKALCGTLELPLIGCHGATIKLPESTLQWDAPINTTHHQHLVKTCIEWCNTKKGVRVEPKSHSIAIHYRAQPNQQTAIYHFLKQLAQGYPDYTLVEGKCVWELRQAHFNKATAIARLLQTPPFKNKLPVMIGDDTTDEPAFAWVNTQGGLSIHVGNSPITCARYKVPSPEAVRYLLTRWLALANT